MKHEQNLIDIYLKYEGHPDFYKVKITCVNQKSIDDDTMLHIAARTGAIDDIEKLVMAGADINAIGDLGNTPLHQAAMFGQLKSVIALLRYRAKTTIRNEFNEIPAELAKNSGYDEIEKLIKIQHPIDSYPKKRKK